MYYSALIGSPTEHSVSHIMFEELAKAAKFTVPYKHIKIDLDADELISALQAFKSLKFAGLNVTLPYKLAIMPLLDECDDVVKELGAVNSVKIGHTVSGHNTDWLGIYKPIHNLGKRFETATVFGSGGAARAAIYAVRKLGVDNIYVLHRNKPNNPQLEDLKQRSQELGIHLLPYSEVRSCVKKSSLVINATSAGMVGMDRTPFDLKELTGLDVTQKVYFDAVFNPLITELLSYFQKNGAITIDGLWMMILQGVAAMELWTDQTVRISDEQLLGIHSLLAKELGHV